MLDDLTCARLQMAISLGFHIVFATVGIGMPLLMVAAEWRWLRTGDPVYRELARHWARGTAVLFAVGAVSGTVLSFELGLLWPAFMERAGAVIGLPFALEGFAFFTEAVFLGIYLYGWDRIGRWQHLAAGVVVGVSGVASAVFVIMVNGWMNAPRGFAVDPSTSAFTDVDPLAAMANPAWATQAAHMLCAAYAATGFAAAGVHAARLLREPWHPLHVRGLGIAMAVGAVFALLQPITGDRSARMVAATQPAKLAALEGQFDTERRAPLRIGGWPSVAERRTTGAVELPGLLSWLAHGAVDAEVVGLDAVPERDWPPVAVVHVAFQAMVALGVLMAAVAAAFAVAAWRDRGVPAGRRALLRAVVATAPAGFLAIEAGWIVTEVGRQPWIVQGVLRSADAVTPMPGLWVPLLVFSAVYVGLAVVVVAVLRLQVSAVRRAAEADR